MILVINMNINVYRQHKNRCQFIQIGVIKHVLSRIELHLLKLHLKGIESIF